MQAVGLLAVSAGLLLSPAARAADVCAHPGGYLAPIAATHTLPPYPDLSQMTGEEGTTSLQVAIGVDGAATKVDIERSSGSLRLDQAAQDFVKANYRWQPPTIDCKPSGTVTRLSIVWSLSQEKGPPPGFIALEPAAANYPADALARHDQGTALVALALSANGEIERSMLQVSSGFPSLDDRAMQLAKAKKWSAAQMDGRPAPTVIEVAVEWKLPQAPAR